MKTNEQIRGEILKKRLNLINKFLLTHVGTDVTFGEFMKKQGMSKKTFFEKLPAELYFKDLHKQKYDSPEIKNYLFAGAKLYQIQFLQHHAKKLGVLSADGSDDYNANGTYFEAGGENFIQRQKRKARELAERLAKAAKEKAQKLLDAAKDASERVRNKLKEDAEKLKDLAKKGLDTGKTIAFAPVRGAFLSILSLNIVGIASAFDIVRNNEPERWKEILKKWDDGFGGKPDKLEKAVDNGKGKRKLFSKLIKKKGHGADGTMFYADADAENEKNPAKIVAIAGSSIGAIGGILLLTPEPSGTTKLVAGYLAAGGAAIVAFSPILKGISKKQGENPDDFSIEPPPPGDPLEEPETMPPPGGGEDGGGTTEVDAVGVMQHLKKKWYFYAGGVLLAGIGGFLLLRRK